jgi:FkbM family methyltransferase
MEWRAETANSQGYLRWTCIIPDATRIAGIRPARIYSFPSVVYLPAMGIGRIFPRFGKIFLVSRALKTGPLLRFLGFRKIKRFGVAIDTRSPFVSDHCVAALFWGIYEWGERRAILQYILKDCPVIELGASLGFISCLAARQTPGQPQVAVEANPHLLPLLRGNIAGNGALDKVHVQWNAIDYGGAAEVNLDLGTGSSLSGAVAADNARSASTSTVVVTCTTVAAILRERNLSRYVLICDIEGAEAGLLREDPATIAACQQMIIELHDATLADGTKVTPYQLGEKIAAAWALEIVRRDGNVWVLQRPAAHQGLA